MKRKIIFVALGIILGFFSTNAVFAESNSCSIAVSCTIPAIPGVNAPALLEEETLKPASSEFAEEKEDLQPENPQPSLATIANENVEEVKLPQGEPSLLLVRTIYPR